MVLTKDAVGLYGAYYQDGSGVFEIEQESYEVKEDETVDIKIVRKLGSKGEATVYYSTPSGGAEQGVNYQYQNDTITFADGETEKTVTVKIYHSPKVADGLNFYFVLDSVTGGSLGTNNSANVVIRDIDEEAHTEAQEALAAEISKVSSIYTAGKGNYTDESWEAFVNAYLVAENTDNSADADTLNSVMEALKKAFEGLQKKAEDKPVTVIEKLSAPNVTSAVSTLEGVKITFSASANSANYEIYRKKGNGQPVKIGVTTETVFVDKKPAANKNMTYMVKAVSGDTSKYESSDLGEAKTLKLPKAAKKITVKATSAGVKVTVKPVKGIKKYILLRSEKKDGSYKKIKKLTAKKAVTYTDKKAKKGKKYYYKVVAVKGKLYSPAKISKAVKVKK